MKLLIITGGFDLLPHEYAPNCIVKAGNIIVGEKPKEETYKNAMSYDSIKHLPEGVIFEVINI